LGWGATCLKKVEYPLLQRRMSSPSRGPSPSKPSSPTNHSPSRSHTHDQQPQPDALHEQQDENAMDVDKPDAELPDADADAEQQENGDDEEAEPSGAEEEEQDEELVSQEWNVEEIEALVDYVARYGLSNWTGLANDPILSLRHNGPNHCEAKFDELFSVTEEDLEYHFPLIEPPKRKVEKSKKSKADNDDDDDDAEEEDEDEDDEDREKKPKMKKSSKDDDEFTLDDHDDEEDDEEDSDEDEDFDDDPLVHEIQELELDEELDYHPAAYYPDIFKRPRKMGQIRIRPSVNFGQSAGENGENEKEDEYVPRGTRSSVRIRDSKRISYKLDEKDDEFDEVVSRSSGDDEPEPTERIDKVLAMREITKELVEEESEQQKIVKQLADKEVHDQHPETQLENVTSEEASGAEQAENVEELEKARNKRHTRIENKINMLHADKKGIIVQYLIKPEGVSYKHCEWLAFQTIKERFGEAGTAKILRFENKRLEIEEENEELWGGEHFNPAFVDVEKVIAKGVEDVPLENGQLKRVTKYLVKWSDLPYTECTWETIEDVDDQAKIAEFYKYNTPHSDSGSHRERQMDPARLTQYFQQSPDFFKNNNKLRDYQLDGLNWFIQCYHLRRNVILADEMGLGKTVQSISFLYYLYMEEKIRGPFLIVVPLSTIQHWKREIQQWTEMNVILYYEPTDGKRNRSIIREHEFYYPGTSKVKFNILLTTYETLIADVEDVLHIGFEYVVVDEGHRLKNKNTKLLRCLQRLSIKRRILLTGTPIQNNTEELWTLLNFVEPDTFFSAEEFLSRFGNLTETAQVDELQMEIRPFVLRRMKENVEKSIPPKEETIIDIELTTLQKQYYRAIYEKNRDFLYKGLDKANLPSLINIEMELRKCCNHPWLIKGAEDAAFPGDVTKAEYFRVTVEASGKLVLLDKLLPKLKSEGHRVLIFSQMKKVLDILQEYVEYKEYDFERLDGSSQGNVRQAAIDRFSKKGSKKFIFLLSTRAGGVGLNLTAADTVIIYDSDWNPQQDIQAQARVHRIGQQKNVMIYRLVTRNTYEAEMFDRASKKLGLEQAVMSQIQKSNQQIKPDKKELDRLLKLGAYGLMDDDEAAKKFTESSIDDILKHGTRVVRHSAEEGAATGALGSINFSKMTFASAGADTSIDINDPDFWNKVLKANDANKEIQLDELSLALVDGSAVKTARARKDFFGKLKQKVQQAFKKKAAGQDPKDLNDTVSLLRTVVQTAKFLDSEKKTAKAWIKELQKKGRGRGGYDSADDEEVVEEAQPEEEEEEEDFEGDENEESEAEGGEDDDDEDDEVSARGNRRKSRNATASGIRKGGMNNKQVPKGELCGTCHKRGQFVECDGPCVRGYHPECIDLDSESIPSSSKPWECPICESGQFECLVCGEAAAIDEGGGDGVLPCSQAGCGAFYHEECIKTCHLAHFFKEGNSKFRCPRHYCAICEKSGLTVHCEFCPSAYHPACFPTSSEYARLNQKTIICSSCLPQLKSDAIGSAAIANSIEGKVDTDPVRPRTDEAVKGKKRGRKKKFTPGMYSVRFKMTDTEPQTFEDVPVFLDGDGDVKKKEEEPSGTSKKKSRRSKAKKEKEESDEENMDVDGDAEVTTPATTSSRSSRRVARSAAAAEPTGEGEDDEEDGDGEEDDYRPKKRQRTKE
jgi:hypothetical protein